MKTILGKYKLLVTLMLVVVVGCNDVLEEQPRTVLVPSFFETGDGLRAGITAAYSFYRYYYGSEPGMNMTVWGTDEFRQGQQVTNPPLDVYVGITADEGAVLSLWNNSYPAINTCNGIIELGEAAGDLSEDEKKALIAEAKFIRAHWYFLLVQTFGPVTLDLGAGPLKFNTEPTSEFTRASTAEVWAAIIQDLEDAIRDLPATRVEQGRAWKATALHVLAKAYLTRGWSEDAEAGDFDNAHKHATDLIDNQAAYGVSLLPDYADVHAEGNEGNSEVLWTIEWNGNLQYNNVLDNGNQYNNGSNFYFRSFYVQDIPGMIRDVENGRPWIRYCPTPWLIDIAFGDKTNDSRYDKSFQSVWYINSVETSPVPLGDVGDTAIWHAPKHFEDQLGSAGAAEAWASSKDYIVTWPSYEPYVANATSFPNVPRNAQNKHYPSLKKYDAVERPIEGTDADPNISSTRPFIVYRLAETYLIAAEAALKRDNDQAAAKGFIDEIRKRAAWPGKVSQMTAYGAGDVDIDFILDERSRELAGEQMRWFDLKRTGKLIERVNVADPANSSEPVEYNRQWNEGAAAADSEGDPLTLPNPQPFHLLRPIPQQQLDRTQGDYPQNPEYNGN